MHRQEAGGNQLGGGAREVCCRGGRGARARRQVCPQNVHLSPC